MKRHLLVALVAAVLALTGLAVLSGCSAPGTDTSTEAKAAIIDQLYSLQPNQAFIDKATGALEDYGFNVDLYQGDEVTVDFYRQLPSHGYKLIIFRVHSGVLVREHDAYEAQATFLFSSEPYSETEYVSEQKSAQMAVARTDEQHPYVFAIGAKFVTTSMKGTFDDTVIIMMGCATLHYDDMAQAFIEKGASTYLGWDASVDLQYVDRAALDLIVNLLTEGMTVEEAVLRTMTEVGRDPTSSAQLGVYPERSANHTIAELMR